MSCHSNTESQKLDILPSTQANYEAIGRIMEHIVNDINIYPTDPTENNVNLQKPDRYDLPSRPDTPTTVPATPPNPSTLTASSPGQIFPLPVPLPQQTP
jgi:hypothetical protein